MRSPQEIDAEAHSSTQGSPTCRSRPTSVCVCVCVCVCVPVVHGTNPSANFPAEDQGGMRQIKIRHSRREVCWSFQACRSPRFCELVYKTPGEHGSVIPAQTGACTGFLRSRIRSRLAEATDDHAAELNRVGRRVRYALFGSSSARRFSIPG